jgi:acetoin utilization deacetylase AcuC-like enzyme
MRILKWLSLVALAAITPTAALAHPGLHHAGVATGSEPLLLLGFAIAAAIGSAALYVEQARR